MQFAEYQDLARRTDQVASDDDKGKIVPLLGLAGEVGTLLSEYKKYLRDGSAHERFDEQVAEELGDLLWYIANVASKFGLDLEEVARANLSKTRGRWPDRHKEDQEMLFDSDRSHLLDENFEAEQQIPRKFVVQLTEVCEGDSVRIIISRKGQQNWGCVDRQCTGRRRVSLPRRIPFVLCGHSRLVSSNTEVAPSQTEVRQTD